MDNVTAFSNAFAALTSSAIFLAVWYLLQIIAYWRVFTKAGEAGWKSIIPFYNYFIQYRLCWKTLFFWIGMAGAVVGTLMYAASNGAVSFIGGVLVLAASVLGMVGMHKLSAAFGHGFGFTLGLIFFNPLFLLILGFGKSEYHRPQ